MGRLVSSVTGQRTFEEGVLQLNIDLEDEAAGLYLLQFAVNGKYQTFRILQKQYIDQSRSTNIFTFKSKVIVQKRARTNLTLFQFLLIRLLFLYNNLLCYHSVFCCDV